MTLHTSLLALVLFALCGGMTTASAEIGPVDVPVEAPAAPDAPAEADPMDGEEDAVRVFRSERTVRAAFCGTWDATRTVSPDTIPSSPPPER